MPRRPKPKPTAKPQPLPDGDPCPVCGEKAFFHCPCPLRKSGCLNEHFWWTCSKCDGIAMGCPDHASGVASRVNWCPKCQEGK
jgi:hypothetical protein